MFVSVAVAVLLFVPVNAASQDGMQFTKPSEAYAYARQPQEEWEAAIRAGHSPKTKVAPREEAQQRAKVWCPVFAVEDQAGEELYFLATLCRDAFDHKSRDKAVVALDRYLNQPQMEHGPEARVLLAGLERADLAKSWQIIRIVLQRDPIGFDQAAMMDSLIDEKAAQDESAALEWSKERYEQLLNRARQPVAGDTSVSFDWVVTAGVDLAHRYYLRGSSKDAQRILVEVNQIEGSRPANERGFAWEHLRWANMEMHPAPPIPIAKLLGSASTSQIIQKGRVEVISFFFLGCAPCMAELPALNELQQKYPRNKVLVVDTTSYKANSYLDRPTHARIEAALEKMRRRKSSALTMVITPDEAIASYRVDTYPVTAVIDKKGLVRFVDHVLDFDNDEPIARLVHKLTEE